jgi:hypothetical protein
LAAVAEPRLQIIFITSRSKSDMGARNVICYIL